MPMVSHGIAFLGVVRSQRLRTTHGTTAILEVVPRSDSPGSGIFAFRFWVRLCCDSSNSPRRRAALCAAHVSARTERQRSNHGVSDPGVRAGFRPALVRRGRSRHGCRCLCRLPERRCSVPRIAANQVRVRALNGAQIFRTIWTRSCGKSWSQSRTGSARDQAIDPAFAVNTICARFRPRIRARSCTSSDATTITLAMLDLCSASCKARRFAPPAHARGLRALTMPARRSVLATTRWSAE